MKTSVLTEDVCFCNPSTKPYHIISGLQSLCVNPKKGKKLGTIRTLEYHKYPCGSELVYSKRDFQTFYFTLTITTSNNPAAINISVHHILLTLYRTLNQCFFVPSSLLEYFITSYEEQINTYKTENRFPNSVSNHDFLNYTCCHLLLKGKPYSFLFLGGGDRKYYQLKNIWACYYHLLCPAKTHKVS